MRSVRFFALIGLVAFFVYTPSASSSLSNVSSLNETTKTFMTGPVCVPRTTLNGEVNIVRNGAPSNSATAANLLAQFSQQGTKSGQAPWGSQVKVTPPPFQPTAPRPSSQGLATTVALGPRGYPSMLV